MATSITNTSSGPTNLGRVLITVPPQVTFDIDADGHADVLSCQINQVNLGTPEITVRIDAIAELLGHSSLAMTQRYTHLGMDVLRDAVARIPAPAVPEGHESGPPVAASIKASKGSGSGA